MKREEDRYGSVWFGSWGAGLVQITFDKNKEIYQTSNYNTSSTEFSSISNNNIRDILEDRHGDLWVGTSNGLNRIKYTESEILSIEKFYNIELNVHPRREKKKLSVALAKALGGVQS